VYNELKNINTMDQGEEDAFVDLIHPEQLTCCPLSENGIHASQVMFEAATANYPKRT